MEFKGFHFENPLWFFGLGILPCLWLLYRFFSPQQMKKVYLECFIDKDLLPHLLVESPKKRSSLLKSLSMWSVIWGLLMGALAGPRWDYKDVQTFVPDQNLCILLDISSSMDARDQKPSRLIRARQKIEDILTQAQGVKVSLIAFAADSHMITPLTDDMDTIRHFLPSLSTDLGYVQGSRLSPALTMASRLLNATQSHNKTILIISDGGFENNEAIALARQLAQEGIVIYTMGVGTEEGGPVPTAKGSIMRKEGRPIVSRLEKEKLMQISQLGGGKYLTTDYSDDSIKALLTHIKQRSHQSQKTEQTARQWEERFYLFVFPLMALLLLWFRRNFTFPVFAFFFFFSSLPVQATQLQDFFKNESQLAKQAFEKEDYETAKNKFK